MIAAAGCLALAGCSGSVPAPEQFENFKIKDEAFQLEVPAGWERDSGAPPGKSWARFDSGSASIHVASDTVGSLLAGGQPEPGTEEQFNPVYQLHQRRKEAMAKDLGGFEEVNTEQVESKFGYCWRTEYAASSLLTGETHGCFYTVLGRDRRIVLTCECSEADWERLKPAFDRAHQTLRRCY